MAEQTQAVSSPADDVFNGENVTFEEFNRYRTSGEVPDRFKQAEQQADPAPAETPEQEETPEGESPEQAPAPEPEEDEEQLPETASRKTQRRFQKLLAEKKELERRLAAKQDVQPESSPAQPQAPPQNFEQWQATFRPSKWIEDYGNAHPEATYDDANFAMAVHIAKAQKHFDAIEQRVKEQEKALNTMVEEANERYGEDFEPVKQFFADSVLSDKGVPLIPPAVLEVINDSDVLADLIFTIGSDEKEMERFVAMAKASPTKAIRYVARVENLIQEELSKGSAGEQTVSGEKAPESKKTAAPKPPTPVGGGSTRTFDVSDESLSPEEWMQKRNAQLAKKA